MVTRKDVVACVVTDGRLVCLVRRSQHVTHDQGRWHCVTGYLDDGATPRECAFRELEEELSLARSDVDVLHEGPLLNYRVDHTVWVVHTFLASTSQTEFQLNWENEAFVWTAPGSEVGDCVPWLADVHSSVLTSDTPRPASACPT